MQQGSLTIELLEDALDSTRAATAAHGDVELVCVGHVVGCGGCEIDDGVAEIVLDLGYRRAGLVGVLIGVDYDSDVCCDCEVELK